MKEKLPKIILAIFLILVLLNLGFLDWWIIRNRGKAGNQADLSREIDEVKETVGATPTPGCQPGCLEIIAEKVVQAISALPTPKTSKTTVVVPTISSAPAKVSYIPLISEAAVGSEDWQDILPSDFYFDLKDYPTAKNVRFEVYLKGNTSVRLYDLTNKRAVDYSDLSSSSEAFELQRSSDLTIWRGNNLYRLQGRTLSGFQGYIKEAKLKIIQ